MELVRHMAAGGGSIGGARKGYVIINGRRRLVWEKTLHSVRRFLSFLSAGVYVCVFVCVCVCV